MLIEGNDVAGHSRLFVQVKERLSTVVEGPVIVISAADVANLQALQRKVVAGCLEIELPDNDEVDLLTVKVCEISMCLLWLIPEPQTQKPITLRSGYS